MAETVSPTAHPIDGYALTGHPTHEGRRARPVAGDMVSIYAVFHRTG